LAFWSFQTYPSTTPVVGVAVGVSIGVGVPVGVAVGVAVAVGVEVAVGVGVNACSPKLTIFSSPAVIWTVTSSGLVLAYPAGCSSLTV